MKNLVTPAPWLNKMTPEERVQQVAAAYYRAMKKMDGAGGDDMALRIDQLHLKMRVDAAHGRDAPRDRIVGSALEAHRAGLGHAVGDGHVPHVHLVHDAAHHLDRAGRARHDARAQGGEVGRGEAGMAELGDEHGGHAVERGAALGRDGREHGLGIEATAGKDHGGPVGEAGEHAHHHAEAMVERYRDADAVFGRQALRSTDKVGVVEDVVVGECRPLGCSCGAAGELDVDRLVELQRARQLGQALPLRTAAGHGELGEGQRAGARAADLDHALQLRQARAAQPARRTGGKLGR